jgi:hypothetical protein
MCIKGQSATRECSSRDAMHDLYLSLHLCERPSASYSGFLGLMVPRLAASESSLHSETVRSVSPVEEG